MKKETELRYTVLLALYSEYLKDDGDFRRITGRSMGIDGRKFV